MICDDIDVSMVTLISRKFNFPFYFSSTVKTRNHESAYHCPSIITSSNGRDRQR